MLKDVERILYFESYVVVDPGLSALQKGEILHEDAFQKAQDEYGEDSFVASIGAEAIKHLLADLDLPALKAQLTTELVETNSEVKRKKIVKRLKLVEDFLNSGISRNGW
jgi:DNA-directed RNA polymerase subunit beta'